MTTTANTDARVLGYLKQEADMDGYVTTIQREVAAATGYSQSTVGTSLQRLERSGLLKCITRGNPGGRGTIVPGSVTTAEYQLLGEEWS